MSQPFKRTTDVLLSSAGLIVAAPIMGVVAALLWIEAPGHVIFSQERLGFRGRPFRIHKFRKFPANWANRGPGVTVAGDARMTPLGAFLERTKLDELPQLWNILKGEMSFVGPRPESVQYADLFHGELGEVLNFRPGLFGPNQVEFRNESAMYPPDEDPDAFYRRELFPRKARNDIKYFRQANWLTDQLWVIRGLLVSIVGVVDWREFAGLHLKILFADYAAILTAWSVAFFLRFYSFSGQESATYLFGLIVFPVSIIAGMFVGGCYRYPVRYFDFPAAARMIMVVSMCWLLSFLMLLWLEDRHVSFLLLPMGWFGLVTFLALPRSLARLSWDSTRRRASSDSDIQSALLIYGAGKRGGALAEWVHYGTKGVRFVGFLDDDPALKGRHVFGFPIHGREGDISTIALVHKITEIWCTFLPDQAKRARLETLCSQSGVNLVFIPELEPFCRFSLAPGTQVQENLVVPELKRKVLPRNNL